MQQFGLLYIDFIATAMLLLGIIVGFSIWYFAKRYMLGDSYYKIFMANLSLLLLSQLLLFTCNNMLLLLACNITIHYLLVRLIIHKNRWLQAVASGKLALRHLMSSNVLIALGFYLLHDNSWSLQEIINNEFIAHKNLALTLILAGIFIQVANWPWHKWLLSSLNAPTPITALLQSLVINSACYLLIRLAPLYLNSQLLPLIALSGAISAIIANWWQLIQTDNKKRLTCSTVAQLGFIVLQCGLGLYGAALMHIISHSLAKSYLFLSSNSLQPTIAPLKPLRIRNLVLSLALGIVSSYICAYISDTNWSLLDSNIVLLGMIAITFTQFAQLLLSNNSYKNLLFYLLLLTGLAFLYGSCIYNNKFLNYLNKPQPFNIWHILLLMLFTISWLGSILWPKLYQITRLQPLMSELYFKLLNSSQVHPSTITAHRNNYNYHGG